MANYIFFCVIVMVFQTNVYIFFIVWLQKINKELIFDCAQSFLACNKYTSCVFVYKIFDFFFVFVMRRFNSSELSREARAKYLRCVYFTRFSIWLSFLSTLSTTILERDKNLVTFSYKLESQHFVK